MFAHVYSLYLYLIVYTMSILLCTHVCRKSSAGGGSQRPGSVRGEGEEGAPAAGGGGPIMVSFQGSIFLFSLFCRFVLSFPHM
jgi:hypothetical protein